MLKSLNQIKRKKKKEKKVTYPELFNVIQDYEIIYPSYEKTYGSDSFFSDIFKLPFEKFVNKVAYCEEPFKEIVNNRYIALTQTKTKSNKERFDKGVDSLLPFQREWKRKKQSQSIVNRGKIEKDKAQKLFNEKMKARVIPNGS